MLKDVIVSDLKCEGNLKWWPLTAPHQMGYWAIGKGECSGLGVVVVQSLSYVWLFAIHGLQHARLPCPSPSPRVCSNSCPLSQWCHPTISSSVTRFSSSPQSFPALRSFPRVGSSHQVAKVSELQLQHQPFHEYSGLISFRIDWLHHHFLSTFT